MTYEEALQALDEKLVSYKNKLRNDINLHRANGISHNNQFHLNLLSSTPETFMDMDINPGGDLALLMLVNAGKAATAIKMFGPMDFKDALMTYKLQNL